MNDADYYPLNDADCWKSLKPSREAVEENYSQEPTIGGELVHMLKELSSSTCTLNDI
ncbi:hypothetical protein KIN20_002621 [Parelaphostrongylus tenuis]|uniref:Uncharacterized protein n=1 Tax=Parelaphostrongylus tenuis TaxID=148309 RepID=A0AAD5QFI1_PARTN|nr:hypothetical protein KIN20_002621 [Parelaphostrongylus tenuis]